MKRFFVRVFAPSRQALRALQEYDLDLFRGTSVASRAALRTRAVDEKRERASRRAEALATTALDRQAEVLFNSPSIEGLLTLDQIERLVVDGFRVLIDEDADRRARARTETIEFSEWLRGMEGE
jgi:hypothetical protein